MLRPQILCSERQKPDRPVFGPVLALVETELIDFHLVHDEVKSFKAIMEAERSRFFVNCERYVCPSRYWKSLI